jgi:hypothetical protein
VLLLFKMGYNNDLVMRGSIPSLFYIWAFVGWILVETWKSIRRRRVAILHALIVCLLLIGSYTSFSEIGRSIFSYHFGPPDRSQVETIAEASFPYIVEQRIGRADSIFYRTLGR